MQSYGAGQALAELIANGRYQRFDASALARRAFRAWRAGARRAAHLSTTDRFKSAGGS